MRIIIIGAGDFGYHIAKALCKKNDVVIVEKEPASLDRIGELDVHTLQGNGGDVKVLVEAGVKKADLFVAVTRSDELNIVACMAAKLLNPDIRTIARVSNPDYIDKPVDRRNKIGVDAMVCPELALAAEFEQVVSMPSAVSVENLVSGKVKMVEFKINKFNPLVGKKLSEANIPHGCVISAIFRKSELMIPHGDDVILVGDRILSVGRLESITEFRKMFGESPGQKFRVAIIGGGNVGFYLANMLRKTDFYIKLIERDKKRCEELAEKLRGILIVHGDGTDISLLKEEDIGSMDVTVSATDSDERNLLCSLLAKQFGAKKVAARVDRFEYTRLFEMVGIDVAMSPIQATVNEVLKSTMGTGIESLINIEEEKGKIIELTANQGSKAVSAPLKDLKFPKGAIISVIVRDNDVIVPDGSHVIAPGDRVIVFALTSAVSKVESLFG
ncbi:MAG TPA: Trk system potassium transporter TrkA [Candidatus Methanoperedenaceae archaeon]|nr:Trk system potassium transporter TrkA [Candidatus Methanoperedenaceae archaeon]